MTDKKDLTVKVIPYRKDTTTRLYSNYVRVVSGPRDVTIQFCDVRPPESDEVAEELKKNPVMKSPIEVEVTLPIDVANSLLNVFKKQLELVSEKGNGKRK